MAHTPTPTQKCQNLQSVKTGHSPYKNTYYNKSSHKVWTCQSQQEMCTQLLQSIKKLVMPLKWWKWCISLLATVYLCRGGEVLSHLIGQWGQSISGLLLTWIIQTRTTCTKQNSLHSTNGHPSCPDTYVHTMQLMTAMSHSVFHSSSFLLRNAFINCFTDGKKNILKLWFPYKYIRPT